jgi:tetratricopeptide (TPR) repeat protein
MFSAARQEPRPTQIDFLRHALAAFLLLVAGLPTLAAISIEPFEQLIQQGQPEEAMTRLGRELERRPDNARLLYDYGVAAYAAKRYDEALLAFDKVEATGSRALVEKARAQKGNAEFRLGLSARTSNLDETIERWKTSLAHYRGALKAHPANALARNNHDLVEKMLMELLLKTAQQHMVEAHKAGTGSDKRVEELRNAMEKFQEALRVDDKDQPALQGEKQAREELAEELAKQGEKQARRRPDQPVEWQIKDMEKGVNKLEDANRLVPENKPIEQKLDAARQALADALTELAQKQIEQSKKSTWDKEKFEKLDKAMENAEKALDQKPEHQQAKETLELAREELAKLHEQRGDQEVREAEHASLLKTAEKLQAALEDYKEAGELKPGVERVVDKANDTEQKLEAALQKLADKMMQDPPKETLEAKAGRLETAEQALQDLQELNPKEQTRQQLETVEERLARVRQELAEQNRRNPPQPAAPQPEPDSRQASQNQPQPDFEKMPAMKQQPLGKGDFKSDQMSRNSRDY